MKKPISTSLPAWKTRAYWKSVVATAAAALAPMSGFARTIQAAGDSSEEELLAQLSQFVKRDITPVPAAPSLRCRHVIKQGIDWYLLFNEEREPIRMKVDFAVDGERHWVDAVTDTRREISEKRAYRPRRS